MISSGAPELLHVPAESRRAQGTRNARNPVANLQNCAKFCFALIHQLNFKPFILQISQIPAEHCRICFMAISKRLTNAAFWSRESTDGLGVERCLR